MSLCIDTRPSFERVKVDRVAPKVSPRESGGRRGGKVLVPGRKSDRGGMLQRRVGQGEGYRLRGGRQTAAFLRVK